MKFKIVFFLLQLFIVSAFAQNITISGYVQDAATGEKLIGANVYNLPYKIGTTTNAYGFYSLQLPKKDSLQLFYSYVGYQAQKVNVPNHKNMTINIELAVGKQLEAVVITGQADNPIEDRNEMSVVSIPIKQIKILPALSGEVDIMKVMQLMPGVQSGSEGSSGLYVRGGSPDQNLMLLDDVPLYNVNHIGGFVSIFNTDAIKSVKLIKGGFPARYGSRLSSVMDVRMKDGNNKEFHGQGLLGIIASKVAVEGPIKKDTASYMISVRRFLWDLLTRPISKIATDGAALGYNFYDINAKFNYYLKEKDHLYLSFYAGDDKLLAKIKNNDDGENQKLKSTLRWGNLLGALRWNHLFNPKLFSNATLSYTRYRYATRFSYSKTGNNINNESENTFVSGVSDLTAKIDMEYYASSKYLLRMGLGSIHHRFRPGTTHLEQIQDGEKIINSTFEENNLTAWEQFIFAENEIKIGKFNSIIGLRATNYHVNGKAFYALEPRILLNYKLLRNLSIKVSYAEMQQYVHFLTSSGVGLPTDLWMPSTDKTPPEKSKQFAVGIAQSISNGKYELSIEAYRKKMNKLITYKAGENHLSTSKGWEEKVEKDGKGISEGVELLVQKKEGKTTGWVGYTLSKTTRQFENINDGAVYDFRYDRRHDISIVITHQLKENIDASATWVFGTGNAITLPIGRYYLGEDEKGLHPFPSLAYADEAELYSKRNAFRMRSYHRLDVGFNFHKKKKWGERIWSVSIYNLYNRQNPYFYYFDTPHETYTQSNPIPTKKPQQKLFQQSLFPIIPSVAYRFEF